MDNVRITAPRLLRFVAYAFICALALALGSCNLDAADCSREASVSVTIPSASATTASPESGGDGTSRAIASGSGFLYLQTGLTAQNAKLYGPYPVVPGATVKINSVPAATYPAIAVFFVPTIPASPLEPVIPTEATREGLRLATQAALSAYPDICSSSSVALVENFEVMWGARNTLSATLVPTTALAPNADGALSLLGSGSGDNRRFIRFSGIGSRFASNTANATMTCTVKNPSPDPVTVSSVGLYDSAGKYVPIGSAASTIAAGGTETFSSAWTGDDVYYLYVDFTGAGLRVDFPGVVTVTPGAVPVNPAVTHTVTFNGNGGTGTMASQSVAEGSTISLPANVFTMSGYYFAGWSTTPAASVPEYGNNGSFVMGTADVNLYAVWSVTPAPVISALKIATGGTYVLTPSPSVSCTILSAGSGLKSITLSGDVASLSSATVSINGTPLAGVLSGLTFTLSASTTETGSFELTGVNLSTGDGLKTVYVSMTDSSGHTSTALSSSVTLDTAPPSVTAPSGPLYAKSGGSFTVSGNVSDSSGLASVSVSFPFADPLSVPAAVSGTSYTGTMSLQGGLSEGSYTYTVHATDNALRGTDASGSLHIDDTPPVINIVLVDGQTYSTSGGTADLIQGSTYTLSVSCGDSGGSGVDGVSFDNGVTYQVGTDLSINPVGSTTYHLYVKDKAGNIGPAGGFQITIVGNP